MDRRHQLLIRCLLYQSQYHAGSPRSNFCCLCLEKWVYAISFGILYLRKPQQICKILCHMAVGTSVFWIRHVHAVHYWILARLYQASGTMLNGMPNSLICKASTIRKKIKKNKKCWNTLHHKKFDCNEILNNLEIDASSSLASGLLKLGSCCSCILFIKYSSTLKKI